MFYNNNEIILQELLFKKTSDKDKNLLTLKDYKDESN